jgi:hypothetical protein
MIPILKMLILSPPLAADAALQLRRAMSIQAEGTKLLENHAIASAASACSAAV